MENKIQWTLSVRFTREDADSAGEVLRLEEEGQKIVSLSRKDATCFFELQTDGMETPFVLETPEGWNGTELELIWLGYRAELWADGELVDEEWPVGNCFGKGDPIIRCISHVVNARWKNTAEIKSPQCRQIDHIQYWAPDLGRHNVGDCMPFSDGERYHLFYLKDRRQHKSKWGRGAHQFAHISTSDLVHWQEHPSAVEITHQWEGSICTGSILSAKGIYYAFYAVRMMDGSSAKVSWATSADCIHFTKSEKYFTLSAPYETTSVRDPEVFQGTDGIYHMLLTTNWETGDVPQRSGCLAHLTSEDLENWEQKSPFLVPGYTDQPECSDYFEWNGWYYLIFSNYGTAKYRYSRTPFGPWICPDHEMIDGLLYRVPKTAEFRGRRIAAGFLCINTEGESYAGSLVLRELCQNPDGSISTCMVKELIPELKGIRENVVLDSGAEGGYRQTEISAVPGYRKITIKKDDGGGSYGIMLRTSETMAWEVRFDSAGKTMGIYPEHSNLYYNPTKRLLTGIDGLEKGVVLELVLWYDILDICINGERTLVCRMEEPWGEHPQSGCFVKDTRAEFTIEG